MVLIDSSVWIDFFNIPESRSAIEVKKLLNENRAAVNDIIIAEVLGGAKNRKEYNLLLRYFRILPHASFDAAGLKILPELNFVSSRKGQRIPITDWLIALSAYNNNMPIYSHDKHFRIVASFLDVLLYQP